MVSLQTNYADNLSSTNKNHHYMKPNTSLDVDPERFIQTKVSCVSDEVDARASLVVLSAVADESDSELSSSSFCVCTPPSRSHSREDLDHVESNMEEMRVNHSVDKDDALNDSTDFSLSESEADDAHNDDYHYPWSADSDDSFAELSDHAVFEKLKEKWDEEATIMGVATIDELVNQPLEAAHSIPQSRMLARGANDEYDGDAEEDELMPQPVTAVSRPSIFPVQSACDCLIIETAGCSLDDIDKIIRVD